ncbi:Glutamate receptor, partial [Thalictrum thalictroides]
MRLQTFSPFLFCFYSYVFIANFAKADNNSQNRGVTDYHVGVVLDMDSDIGKVGWNCIQIAFSDFYSANSDYRTKLFLHLRDSRGDNVQAAFA